MAYSSIDINRMIDLAIGTPDNGVVNFRMLHTLLKVITNRLSLDTAVVEFTEGFGAKIDSPHEVELHSSTRSRTVVTQYCKTQRPEGAAFIQCDSGSDGAVNRKFLISHGGAEAPALSPQQVIQSAPEVHNQVHTIPVRNMDNESESINPPDINLLSRRIDEIQNIVTALVPGSDSGEINLLNINHRLGAVEAEISKVTTAIDGFTKEFNAFTATVAPFVEGGEIDAIRVRLDELERLYNRDDPIEYHPNANESAQGQSG